MKMTVEELFLWKSGTLEAYTEAIGKRNWYAGRVRGASDRMYWEQDALSVFGDDERSSQTYKKHLRAYEKACADLQKYTVALDTWTGVVESMQR